MSIFALLSLINQTLSICVPSQKDWVPGSEEDVAFSLWVLLYMSVREIPSSPESRQVCLELPFLKRLGELYGQPISLQAKLV